VFTALNNPNLLSAGAREDTKDPKFLAGGISNCFSPFPSRLRCSNFVQTIPPATQARILVDELTDWLKNILILFANLSSLLIFQLFVFIPLQWTYLA